MELITKNPLLKNIEIAMAFGFFEQSFDIADRALATGIGWQEMMTTEDFIEWVLNYIGVMIEMDSMMGAMMELLTGFYNFVYQDNRIVMSFCDKKDHILIVRQTFLRKPSHTTVAKDTRIWDL